MTALDRGSVADKGAMATGVFAKKRGFALEVALSH